MCSSSKDQPLPAPIDLIFQSIAGTEAASDFIFDASKLDALLFQHMKIGGSIPSFEFVLESNDFSGTTPNARVIASRFW